MKVIIDMNTVSASGYRDVYEEDDEWVKIKDCDVCSLEIKERCCHDCSSSLSNGNCEVHEKGKPYNCIIAPSIKMCVTHCSLEYKSIKGSRIGQIRRIRDRLNVFIKTA